jgi:ubiquinone/menaquinone biosynthesis C-methylase UbiE
VAREHFADDDRYHFQSASAEHLPFDASSFDVVVCNNAFHLILHAAAALREFHRVLKVGGQVIIIDWCRDAPQMALMAVGLRLTDRQSRRIRTLNALTSLVEEHGFDIKHRERFLVPPLWGLLAVVAAKR